jgi:hypothetical protein
MVTIIEVKHSENSNGKPFVSLKLQGGIEAVQSQQSGKLYLTNRTCLIPTTFENATAEALVGKELPGTIQRVASDPYEFVIKQSGEVIMLSHRYEYVPVEFQETPPVVISKFSNVEV